jgi:ParB family transcriptional regulator, chromosome partitioning protein
LVRPFFNSGLILGLIEEIDISRIKQTINPIRTGFLNDAYNNALANSVKQKGLLHPIIIRACSTDHFEVVAGNRRYQACKSLGHRKIACHIVELDDKAAFEIALIENLQRKTLSPLEEAQAFKKYVSDFGWGGASELAGKICKSVSYITRHIRLLDLPSDIIDDIMSSAIDISTAEELLSIKNKEKQSELAKIVSKKKMSVKETRQFLNNFHTKPAYADDADWMISSNCISRKESIDKKSIKSFDKSILTLRIAMTRIGDIINNIDDDDDNCDWMTREILMIHKTMLHDQLGLLIKEKLKKQQIRKSI